MPAKFFQFSSVIGLIEVPAIGGVGGESLGGILHRGIEEPDATGEGEDQAINHLLISLDLGRLGGRITLVAAAGKRRTGILEEVLEHVIVDEGHSIRVAMENGRGLL